MSQHVLLRTKVAYMIAPYHVRIQQSSFNATAFFPLKAYV